MNILFFGAESGHSPKFVEYFTIKYGLSLMKNCCATYIRELTEEEYFMLCLTIKDKFQVVSDNDNLFIYVCHRSGFQLPEGDKLYEFHRDFIKKELDAFHDSPRQ